MKIVMTKLAVEKLVDSGCTIAAMATHFGITNTPMRRWVKLFNLKTDRQRNRYVTQWTDADLVEAVNESLTKADVLRKFGMSIRAGNYNTLNKHIKRLGLSTAHMTGKAHGRSVPACWRPLSEILVRDSTYNRSHLKVRLVEEGLLEEICTKCGLRGTWQGELIRLVLDHINGVNDDHRLTNLRFLCPNCNSQTPTFCGRNRLKGL